MTQAAWRANTRCNRCGFQVRFHDDGECPTQSEGWNGALGDDNELRLAANHLRRVRRHMVTLHALDTAWRESCHE